MSSTALGAEKAIIFISYAHEKFYYKKLSNLTLVGAVAFLLSFISSGLPDTDHRDDDADNRHYNFDKLQTHSKYQ